MPMHRMGHACACMSGGKERAKRLSKGTEVGFPEPEWQPEGDILLVEQRNTVEVLPANPCSVKIQPVCHLPPPPRQLLTQKQMRGVGEVGDFP